jgi:hypothetical protein
LIAAEITRVVVVEPGRLHWFLLGAVVGYAVGMALWFLLGVRRLRR